MLDIHKKNDYAVEVFIVYKNKVLLRIHDKVKIWLSVGGKINLGENPEDAAVREVKEEVGLDVEIIGAKPSIKDEFDYKHLIVPKYLSNWISNDNHKFTIFVYFAKAKNDVVSESINAHERTETRWVTKEELNKMDLRPNVLFYAEEALKELGEK